MGRGMARSLSRAGFTVSGFDPFLKDRSPFDGYAVEFHSSLLELLADCNVIVMSLPTSNEVEATVSGKDGLLSGDLAGKIIIDTSTSHPAVTKRLSELLGSAGAQLIDAPVSGGPAGAENGALGMVLGGSPDAIEAAMPILEAMSAKRTYVGKSGAGHTLKIINNALCAANISLAAEAVRLGALFGMTPENVIDGLNSGSGRNAATEVNFPKWVLNGAYDSGFTMKLMLKDLRLAGDLLGQTDLENTLIDEVIADWNEAGRELEDTDDFNAVARFILSNQK